MLYLKCHSLITGNLYYSSHFKTHNPFLQYIELLLFFILLFTTTENNTATRPSGVN